LFRCSSYNLGLTKIEPQFAKFNYAEKVEYWAFMWGTVVMTVSGFLLWFNNFTLRHFPKWVSDAATAVHYYEALLATFSILLWHFYMVIFDPLVYPMDTAWLNGKVPSRPLRTHPPGILPGLAPCESDRNARRHSDARRRVRRPREVRTRVNPEEVQSAVYVCNPVSSVVKIFCVPERRAATEMSGSPVLSMP
jgi:hypothetical protein